MIDGPTFSRALFGCTILISFLAPPRRLSLQRFSVLLQHFCARYDIPLCVTRGLLLLGSHDPDPPQTVPKAPRRPKLVRFASDETLVDEACHDTPADIPVWALLTYPVVWSVANYAALALLEISYRALQPLFFSTPIQLGGLGLPPSTIGIILGLFGVMDGCFQALFFAKLIDRWGIKRIFLLGMSMFVPIFLLFPIMNLLARAGGMTSAVWSLVILQLALGVMMDMAYGMPQYLSPYEDGIQRTCQEPSSSTSRARLPTRDQLAQPTASRNSRRLSFVQWGPRRRPRSSPCLLTMTGSTATACTLSIWDCRVC